MKKILILLGAPGVGKGTVGAALKELWPLPLVSSGDLLREHVKQGTALGTQARAYMDKGELVPDTLVLKLIEERISRGDAADGFILDGFPRNTVQADMLAGLIGGIPYTVIYLKAPDELIVRRLSERRVCGECGAIYHLSNIPPATSGICDRCGGALVQRDDDKPEVIANRLAVYYRQTTPLLDYYRTRGALKELSGEGEAADTVRSIRAALQW